MKGRDFQPGVIFKDSRRWLRVKTRGPVITKIKGFDGPAVRLTAEDKDGNGYRATVSADKDYQTADEFPKPKPRTNKVKTKDEQETESINDREPPEVLRELLTFSDGD